MVTCGNKVKPLTVVDTNKIVRNSGDCCIITKTETKDYKIVFDNVLLKRTIIAYLMECESYLHTNLLVHNVIKPLLMNYCILQYSFYEHM